MTPEKLLDAIGQVDEELLVKTEKGARISPRRLSTFVAFAACLCIIVGIGFMPRGMKSAAEETPAAEAPDVMEPADPGTEYPIEEQPAPSGGVDEGQLGAVLVRSEYTDEAQIEEIRALCHEHSMYFFDIPLEELSTYVYSGCKYVIIADELQEETAKLEKKYPFIRFLTPNDVLNGALDVPFPEPEFRDDRVRKNGSFTRCIILDGVEYLPHDDLYYEYNMMLAERGGPYIDVVAKPGENTVRFGDTEYELENTPFLYSTRDDWDEVFYVPAEEFGTLLGLDVSRDPESGVLSVGQHVQTSADFQGTKTLILRYGPGTTTEELREHYRCLYENGCLLGRLTDMKTMEEGDTLVCMLLEPGSFTDFGSLQQMQHDIAEGEKPPMCLAIDPANLGGISDGDVVNWDWNFSLPYYYCLTEETAQLPEQERDETIRSSLDFIHSSVEQSTEFVICPNDCRSLLDRFDRYILDDEGMWRFGERIETVFTETVPPDMSGEELLALVQEHLEN